MSWIGRVVNCYILTVILFLANNPQSPAAQLNYVAKVSGPFVQQSETSQKGDDIWVGSVGILGITIRLILRIAPGLHGA